MASTKKISSEQSIGLIGFPFSKGQSRGGTEHGPSVLREAGIVESLRSLGNTVTDHGDIKIQNIPNQPQDKLKNGRCVGAANKQLSDAVAASLQKKETVLVLGGDHSMGIGSIHGHAQVEPDTVIIWVDAHADLNTPLTSPSGNIHGMPLCFLLRELVDYLPQCPGFEWIKPCLSVKDLVYIGLRDVDPGERKLIEEFGISAYSMEEVDKYGMVSVLEKALAAVDPSGTRPIHLSFDVDAMDPTLAGATGTPVPGGLSLREVFFMAEEIAKTGRLSVLDVAEVNPLLSTEEDQKNTVSNTVDVMTKFFGSRRQGNYPRDFVVPMPDRNEQKL